MQTVNDRVIALLHNDLKGSDDQRVASGVKATSSTHPMAAGTPSGEDSSLLRRERLMLGRFDIRVSPLLSSLGNSVGDARRLPLIGDTSILDLFPSPPHVPAAHPKLMAASIELSRLPPSLVAVPFVGMMGKRDAMDFDKSSRSLSFQTLP